MCFSCPEHERHGGSGGEDVKAALVALAVAALAGLTYRVMEVIWPLYLVLLIAGYLWVYARTPIRKAVRAVRKLRTRPSPAPPTTAAGPTAAGPAVDGHGQPPLTAAGTAGQALTAGDVLAEITARYVSPDVSPAVPVAGELTRDGDRTRAEVIRNG